MIEFNEPQNTDGLIPVRPRTVAELAVSVSGAVEGDDAAVIHGGASIEDAEVGDVVFAENARFLSQAEKSRASAIVAFLEATTPDKPLIKVDNPRYAFIKILELFRPKLHAKPGVHPTAILGERLVSGADLSIGAHVVIGDNARIGDGCVIFPGCVVGDDCVLGANCVLYPNVTLYHGCVLGDRVVLHSGVVIGADGFGYMRIGGEIIKVPQIGIVEIGDDVEIGSNTTVDRAKTGSTFIGARTKIDNLVQIAHNVKIGEDCIVVAQAGVAGSCELRRGSMVAGQAGLKDHTVIGEGAIVLAQAGVFGDVAPGEVVSGYPARPHRDRLRQDAAASKLPGYLQRIRQLEKANSDLEFRCLRLEQAVNALVNAPGSIDEG